MPYQNNKFIPSSNNFRIIDDFYDIYEHRQLGLIHPSDPNIFGDITIDEFNHLINIGASLLTFEFNFYRHQSKLKECYSSPPKWAPNYKYNHNVTIQKYFAYLDSIVTRSLGMARDDIRRDVRYGNAAEILVLHGYLQFRITGYRFYVKYFGRIPIEYIRSAYTMRHQVAEAAPDLTHYFVYFENQNWNEFERIREEWEENNMDTGEQSVHDGKITQFVQDSLEELYSPLNKTVMACKYKEVQRQQSRGAPRQQTITPDGIPSLEEFQRCIRDYKLRIQKHVFFNELSTAINRVTTDQTNFEIYSLSKKVKLYHVFTTIYNCIEMLPQNDIEDGMKRIDEELIDASGQCSVGYLNRLINVLIGYDHLRPKARENFEKEFKKRFMVLVQEDLMADEKADEYIINLGDSSSNELFTPFIQSHLDHWKTILKSEYKDAIDNEQLFILTIENAIQETFGFNYSLQ